jgi:hypothetical protein
MNRTSSPDLMPVLSRGKHRNPKKGACFMELASYLAGEPWSDHPTCTHPLLAAMARAVNDQVGDRARIWLAPLIPEVIGLTSDDPRADAWIAREAALTALPLVSAEKQCVSAVALLICERYLAAVEGAPADRMSKEVKVALTDAPAAHKWAEVYLSSSGLEPGDFRGRSAPRIVHSTVSGLASSALPDPDVVLVDMLQRTIGLCQEWFGSEQAPLLERRWRDVCDITSKR